MVNCPQYFNDYKKYCNTRGKSIDDSPSRHSDHISNFMSILDRLVTIEENGGNDNPNASNDSYTMISSVNLNH